MKYFLKFFNLFKYFSNIGRDFLSVLILSAYEYLSQMLANGTVNSYAL